MCLCPLKNHYQAMFLSGIILLHGALIRIKLLHGTLIRIKLLHGALIRIKLLHGAQIGIKLCRPLSSDNDSEFKIVFYLMMILKQLFRSSRSQCNSGHANEGHIYMVVIFLNNISGGRSITSMDYQGKHMYSEKYPFM